MKNCLTIILLLLITLSVWGQEWVVPADKQKKLSPALFTGESRKAGEQLYTMNCKSCHGTPGKGESLPLVPRPPDPASGQFQGNSDGNLFYKISEGRGQMPSFKNVFTSAQIWEIISFLRSFNKSYRQEIAQKMTSQAYPDAEIRFAMSYMPADKTIVIHAGAVRGTVVVPVTGAGVQLLIHRTFGMIQAGEDKLTDNLGMAVFDITPDFPSDTAGNIRVSARFANEEEFGAVTLDTLIQTGNKLVPVSLRGKRAMWNTVWRAPVWVLLTYFSGLLLAWGVILYVLLMLRDIFVLGDTLKDNRSSDKSDQQ